MLKKNKYKSRKDKRIGTTVKALRDDRSEYRKFIGAHSQRELAEKVQKAEQEFQDGKTTAEVNMTFKSLADIYFNVVIHGSQKAYSYLKTYEKHLARELGHIKIGEIRKIHVKNLLKILIVKGLAKKTIKEILLIARQIINVAIEDEIIYRNVFQGIRLPEDLPEEERHPITDDQLNLIVKSWQSHRMGIPAMLMLYLGLRRGEVLALSWKDIDFENKVLNVSKQVIHDEKGQPFLAPPKTKRSIRCIRIPDFIMDILNSVPTQERKTQPLLCPAMTSKGHMSQSAYKRAWDSYMHHLNLFAGGRSATRSKPKIEAMERFTAHQLRHTCATMLFEAGVDPKTAQKMLGHATLEITLKIYTHLREQKEIASIDAYNQMLNKFFQLDCEDEIDAIAVGQTVVDCVEAMTPTDNVVYFATFQKK